MDSRFVLLGSPTGVPSDESTNAGSVLTSKNNQETEVSSPFPVAAADDDDGNLELGLGLSIGGVGGQYAIAKDVPPSFKKPNSSTVVSPSSVVGWPPLRRGHRLAIQTKSPDEQSSSTPKPNRALKDDKSSDAKKVVIKNGYLPVKVNMDGTLVGRKVDLNTHDSYETLAQTVEHMFFQKPSSTEAVGLSKLLDATSEFVLTYEDKDGDCMLVGDVPWQMFLRSVKRLRIMRNCESSKLGERKRTIASPTCQEKKNKKRF